jgi:hypothetical protein
MTHLLTDLDTTAKRDCAVRPFGAPVVDAQVCGRQDRRPEGTGNHRRAEGQKPRRTSGARIMR